jgi:hypothetical protein
MPNFKNASMSQKPSQKSSALALSILITSFLPHASAFASEIAIDQTLLPTATQDLLRNDFEAIRGISVEDGGKYSESFTQIFGGTSGEDVMRYLEERIHYMGADAGGDKGIYAANYSPEFLSYIYSRDVRQSKNPKVTKMTFENSTVVIDSPRVGFVVVGDAYTWPETSWIDRLDTLVHEARHSDCATIPDAEDLTAYQKSQYLNISIEGRSCTHIHMPCPKGHPLAGELACDDHDWGAYTVGYVFSKTMYRSCVGCSEKQKQEALATATDDFSRLFKDVQDRWLSGTAGTPDMRSVR